jgi:hypothetical protein
MPKVFGFNSPKRVVVLGAGASAHLGYPLGWDLLKAIQKNKPDEGSVLHEAHQLAKCPAGDVELFYNQVGLTRAGSIDRFLDETADDNEFFVKIGRIAIAHELLRAEIASLNFDDRRNWYLVLRKVLLESFELQGPKLGIVTFNYDRSLVSFMESHARTDDYLPAEKNSVLQAAPPQCVHGCLHIYDSMNPSLGPRPYGGEVTPSCLVQAADNIQVIHELKRGHGDPMLIAADMIKKAERVVFLGFGYDTWNLRRLGIVPWQGAELWDPGRRYFGTSFKMKPEERDRVLAQSQQCLELAEPDVDVCAYAAEHLEELLLGA